MLLTPKLDTTNISLWRIRKTSCRKLQSMPQLTTTISKSYLKKYDVNTIKRSWFRLKSTQSFTCHKDQFFPTTFVHQGSLDCSWIVHLCTHPCLWDILSCFDAWCLQRTENMCFLAKKEAKHQPIANLVHFVSDRSFLILLRLQMRNFKGNWNESQGIWNLELHT